MSLFRKAIKSTTMLLVLTVGLIGNLSGSVNLKGIAFAGERKDPTIGLTVSADKTAENECKIESDRLEECLLYLLYPHILNDCTNYFGTKTMEQLTLYSYEMKVVSIIPDNDSTIQLIVEMTPMIGAHNPVADLLIKYQITAEGTILQKEIKKTKEYQETLERFKITLPKEVE